MQPDPPHVRAAGLSTEKAAEEAGKALCGVEGFFFRSPYSWRNSIVGRA